MKRELEYHCSRDDCERTFSTKQGLQVHIARSHRQKEEADDHDDALHAAEEQPIEADDSTEPVETVEDVENPDIDIVSTLNGGVHLDESDLEIVQAVQFLWGYTTDDEILCAAVTQFLEWAADEPNVKHAIKLQRAFKRAHG